jgi:hypothetical protein
MRKAMMAGAAAMLALGGCEDGAPDPQRKVVKPANPTSDGLAKLPELLRFLGLRRAIVDNGQRCKKVDRGHYQQDFKNMAMWTARCTDQVRRCGNLASINLPACKPIPEPQEKAAEPTKGTKQAAPAR